MAGVLAGLARVGVGTAWTTMHAADHGPLFVVGVFGTVIALERAVALGRPWAMAVPLLGGATGVALLLRAPAAPVLAFMSAAGLAMLNAALVRVRPAAFGWVLWMGSALLLLANGLWAGGHPVRSLVPAWLAFLVLTIAAERLRWSRTVVPPRWARHAFVLIVTGSAASAAASVLGGGSAADRFLGVTLALLAVWQLRFDISRHALTEQGMARFTSLGVRAGAVWLLVAGILLSWHGLPLAGPVYDAALHAVFVGQVLGTVFAHAPTMLASVSAVRVPFTQALYVPVLLLQTSLLARVAGDLGDSLAVRRAGSLGNVVALVAFALVSAAAARTAQRRRPEA